MIISPKIAHDNDWISGVNKREAFNPEGAGIDLSIDSLYMLNGGYGAILGDERQTPTAVPVPWRKNRDSGLWLAELPNVVNHPRSVFVMQTRENVYMPANISGTVTPRSTLYRSGVVLTCGNVAPGYEGPLTFGLLNFGPGTFLLSMFARVAHIQFMEVDEEVGEYRGQWQHGRLVQPDPEEQV